VTDPAGELRGWTLYSTDPFKIRWGGLNLELGFPGQYNMVEVPYWYNWHRDYMPEWGRYLQPDPIGLDGGMNRFLYAGANPLAYGGPKGTILVSATCTAVSVVLGGLAIREALLLANNAVEEINCLESQRDEEPDPVDQARIDKDIRDLRTKRAAAIVRAGAAGFGTTIALVVCGVMPF